MSTLISDFSFHLLKKICKAGFSIALCIIVFCVSMLVLTSILFCVGWLITWLFPNIPNIDGGFGTNASIGYFACLTIPVIFFIIVNPIKWIVKEWKTFKTKFNNVHQ